MAKDLAPGDRAPAFKLATDSAARFPRHRSRVALRPLFLSQRRYLRLHQGGDRVLGSQEEIRWAGRQRSWACPRTAPHLTKSSAKHKLKISAGLRSGKNGAGLWRLGGKDPIRPQIHGNGPGDVPGRRQGRHPAGLAQGQSPGSCGGRARRGEKPLSRRDLRNFRPRLTSSSFFWAKSLIKRPELGEMMPSGVGAKDAVEGK
jgi:hypothetical protein